MPQAREPAKLCTGWHRETTHETAGAATVSGEVGMAPNLLTTTCDVYKIHTARPGGTERGHANMVE
jgi:hypothetical protein